jgi:hypothetical protein
MVDSDGFKKLDLVTDEDLLKKVIGLGFSEPKTNDFGFDNHYVDEGYTAEQIWRWFYSRFNIYVEVFYRDNGGYFTYSLYRKDSPAIGFQPVDFVNAQNAFQDPFQCLLEGLREAADLLYIESMQ